MYIIQKNFTQGRSLELKAKGRKGPGQTSNFSWVELNVNEDIILCLSRLNGPNLNLKPT